MSQSSSDLPYDRAAVIENLGGDESLLAEIGGIFAGDWPQYVEKLRGALAAGDAETLRRVAHTVKGSVANFSAERAVQAARELEYAGRDGRLDEAPQLLDAAIAAVEEVIAALKAEATR